MIDPRWLVPDAPLGERVGVVMTTRHGGVSAGPFESMNLGAYVGDEPAAVRANMQRLGEAIDARPVFLKQVHGTRVVDLDRGPADAPVVEADASIATDPGIACTVTVADCLPVLFAAPDGRGVAAAHAGWRGLAGGVVEATLARLCEAAACEPGEVRVWLGACIGPDAFEVGEDVVRAFDADPARTDGARFKPVARVADAMVPKWWANLPGLARDRLTAAGVAQVSGGAWCTVSDASRFFSFRRDRVTGRMAAAIWLRR